MLRLPRSLCLAICVAMVSMALATPQEQTKKSGPEGIWLGALNAAGTKLRLAFHVSSKDGKLSAKMDSLDQAVKGIAVSEITFKDGVLKMEVESIKAAFEGKMNAEGTEIAGEWKQADSPLELKLKRVDKLPMPNRPQEPKRPFPYREEDVQYENKKANIKLAGTLTLPKEGGPFPVVLLITGSGAQNRDEELVGHKPFLVISDHLTRRGIAVLRVDDRGVGGSTGNVSMSTSADFAEDVLAGVELLKGHKEIDAKRMGLIGHSEGGLVGPLAASQSKDVAFVVMLAGPGLPGDEILLLQNRMILEAAKAKKAAIDVQLMMLSLAYPIIKEEKEPKVAEERIRAAFDAWKEKASDEEKKVFAEREKKDVKIFIKQMTNPWMRFFLSHDPRPELKKVECPVLALIGEKDIQVASKQNLEAIEKALKEGGNKDFTVKELPGLNHLFQKCKTGTVSEYAAIEETMSPEVLELMAEWILARKK